MNKAIVMALLVALVLPACGGGSDGSAGYEKKRSTLAKDKKGGAGEAEAAPEAAGSEELDVARSSQEYSYDPKGKRDPFRSYILEQMEKTKAARGPLERFELAQLELAAVIWDAQNERALVRDPSGRGYIVGVGTPIGKNSGTVIGIEDSSVVVEEIYENHLGERTKKNIEMRLRPSQGG